MEAFQSFPQVCFWITGRLFLLLNAIYRSIHATNVHWHCHIGILNLIKRNIAYSLSPFSLMSPCYVPESMQALS